MGKLIICCHNENCADSVERNPTNPKPMVCTGETVSAWTFKCLTCFGLRAVTKDVVGGSIGVGRRDDGSGPHGGKGPSKWRPGMNFK